MIKAKQVRVYLREPEVRTLNELVEITGMRDTAILSLLCAAALKAAKDANYKLPLALKFRVVEDAQPKAKARR
jgi:hypothetical protein